MRKTISQHEFLYESCTFKSWCSKPNYYFIYYFVILLIFITVIYKIIVIHLIENSIGKCCYAGRNIKFDNTDYWELGSKSKYSSMQRTQLTLLKNKGQDEFQQRTKVGKATQSLWVWQMGTMGKKHFCIIQKYYAPNFNHFWSLSQMWTHSSFDPDF